MNGRVLAASTFISACLALAACGGTPGAASKATVTVTASAAPAVTVTVTATPKAAPKPASTQAASRAAGHRLVQRLRSREHRAVHHAELLAPQLGIQQLRGRDRQLHRDRDQHLGRQPGLERRHRQRAGQQAGTGRDATYAYGDAGSHSLQVNSACSWSLAVVTG